MQPVNWRWSRATLGQYLGLPAVCAEFEDAGRSRNRVVGRSHIHGAATRLDPTVGTHSTAATRSWLVGGLLISGADTRI